MHKKKKAKRCSPENTQKDKEQLKIVVYWAREILRDAVKSLPEESSERIAIEETIYILAQGIRNPNRDALLVLRAPKWVRDKWPKYFKDTDGS